eukprot:CAMPEP_0118877008 /NCGR_PEP_ID=MMETSP1163-20130328/17469_1 /TAXON_ID=124430 /ORGANISM="Phaeomonas parva, Strain CCMP2877" /LENGTH=83 /DNA_ID=CAMNT_0006812675 /DNA_START=128 /DNA_END=376 /DNA_ORIENTATION=-
MESDDDSAATHILSPASHGQSLYDGVNLEPASQYEPSPRETGDHSSPRSRAARKLSSSLAYSKTSSASKLEIDVTATPNQQPM